MAFQVPIVVVLLVRTNIVSIEKLKEFRGYFIVLSFVIAAVITPPDVISQLALAVPMCLLYEVGIFAAKWFSKGKQASEDGDKGGEKGEEKDKNSASGSS
jgi:sec-independent protein translocase protein TatC